MPGLSSYLDRSNLIRHFPIFSQLTWIDQQKIACHSRVAEYKKGEMICRRGAPADYLYCVMSGRIQAFTEDPEGKKTDVEFIHRGMYFGIISLLTGEGHSLSFCAMNDSVVLLIEQKDFHEILKAIPQLGVSFSRSLSQRLRKRVAATKSIFESNIISIYSPVKGSGSSTYAANLAVALQKETGKKVVLLHICSLADCERPAPLPKELLVWRETPVPLADIIADDQKILASVKKADGVVIDRLNVSFDPRNQELRHQISQFVTALVNDYHYIIVDLPNEMDEIVLETLAQSDMIHLVTPDTVEHVALTRQVLNKLEQGLKANFHPDKIHVLLSGKQGSPGLALETVNRQLDYDVYARLEYFDRESAAGILEAADMALSLPPPDSAYFRIVRKLARRIGRVRVGLVLGGGAALGLAHIGVLKVIEEEHIPVDVVVGSSMGALIAGLWVTGHSADDIARIAEEFDGKKSFLKLLDPIFPISGFIGGRAIRRWLQGKFAAQSFYDTRIPLKVVAYDLTRRQEIVIGSGRITEAVHRSIAIPGIMRPILEQEKVIIDGGVLNPLPTNVLAGMGVNKIIAVNVLQSPADVTQGYAMRRQEMSQACRVSFIRSPFGFIGCRMSKLMKKIFSPSISDIIVNSLQASEYVIAQQSGRQADVLIHPDLAEFNWFELHRSREFIRQGEAAARQALSSIHQLVKS